MTGANYTGGKRNFARTRFRDSTRRVQKNHFGRRRLGILSRSLANGAHPMDKEAAPGISSILLEHAQREMSHPQTSFRAPRAEPLGAFTTSPSRSSRTGSEVTHTHILDSGSYSSLRAEMDRVLEFSRTVGLCKYLNSRRGGGSELASDDAESEQLDTTQQRVVDYDLAMSELSEGQDHTGYTVQGSEDPWAAHGRPSNFEDSVSPSPRNRRSSKADLGLEYAKATSDYNYQEFDIPQSADYLISTAEPHLDQTGYSPKALEACLCPTDMLPLSFNALEFSTSPLPPSSPLPSSTAFSSLLSHHQTSYTTGETHPDIESDSHKVDIFSRSGFSGCTTPDLPATPLLGRSPHWGDFHKVPILLAPSSKDELIPDLLTHDDPWNLIGDILDLPPIPSADATYLGNILSLPTRSHELVLPRSPLSPALRQADVEEPCTPLQDKGSWSRAVHSDPVPPIHSISPRVQSRHPASSPLLRQNLLAKRPFLPARTFLRDYNPALRDNRSPSPPIRGLPVVTEPLQPLPELQTPLTSPRALNCCPISGRKSSSDLVVKTPSSDSGFGTPERSTLLPFPNHSSSPKTFEPDIPKIMTAPWSAISEIDLDLLIPKALMKQTTKCSSAQPQKLGLPDLFSDGEDSFGGIF